MKYYVFHFGTNPRYLALLHRFVKQWRAVTDKPLTVLTDFSADVSLVDVCSDVEMVDPSEWTPRYHRAGHPGANFDYKACLLMAKFATVQPDDCAFFDSDNLILRDPTAPLESFLARLALPDDGGGRVIVHPSFTGPQTELSTSLMVMRADSRIPCALYRQLWDKSTEPNHPLLEQRTWSLVCHVMGHRLGRAFAWSRFWGATPADAYVKHPHGPEKWEGLEGPNNTAQTQPAKNLKLSL
jgi:hypothetical protein